MFGVQLFKIFLFLFLWQMALHLEFFVSAHNIMNYSINVFTFIKPTAHGIMFGDRSWCIIYLRLVMYLPTKINGVQLNLMGFNTANFIEIFNRHMAAYKVLNAIPH